MSTNIQTNRISGSILVEGPHVRRGPRGYPLLPGGYSRSTYDTGAPSPSPYTVSGDGHRAWNDRSRELIDAHSSFTSLIHGNAQPANLLALSTPMDQAVVADIADRLAGAVLAVAAAQD